MEEQATATLEATATTEAPPLPEGEPAPEVTLDEEGNVTFGEEFWGAETLPAEAAPDEPAPPAEPSAAGYTDEELADTPWEQWDPERITGDVKRYIPLVQEQMRRRAAAAAMMRPTPPAAGPSRPSMTQKEIAAEALKLARERLGLKEDDALDFYEPEHIAAMALASQEVQARDRAEAQRSAQVEQQRREFGAFAADMASRAEFAEFDRWVTGRLAAAGMHPAQLQEYAMRTGDIAGVQRTIKGWWEAWRQQKGASAPQAAPKQAPRPPVVETASGAVQGKKVIDLRGFGDLDADDQARALMDAGLV